MTYGKLKERVMQLIFSYSVAGSEIPETYNNQADYIVMIPGLVNEAQMDIAISHKRLPAYKMLSELVSQESAGWDVYDYPEDCWQIMQGGLLDPNHGNRFHEYRIGLGKQILVRHGTPDNLVLEYWRYPEAVTADTTDEAELDNTPDVHECLPYYVAYGMLLYDDAYRAQVFKAEFDQRISKLREEVWLESGVIPNVYQGEGWKG